MSTVAQLIDRIYREYLYPPREQGARTTITNNPLAAGGTTVSITLGILSVEEENSLGQGVVVEVDSEIMLSTAYASPDITVIREWAGTVDVQHEQDAELRIAPDYPRLVVFDAVADALEGLYPDLFVVKTAESTVGNLEVAPANVGDVVGANYFGHGQWRSCGVKVLKGFPDSGTERAFMFTGGMAGSRAYVRYKAKPTRITAESDDLADEFEDFFVQTRWEQIVVLDAVASIVGTYDVDAATQEFITESLASQGFPPGQAESVRDALLRLSNFKRNQQKTTLWREYPTRMLRDGFAYGDA